MKKNIAFSLIIFLIICGNSFGENTKQVAGASFVKSFGYEGCIELSNTTTKVVLEPNCGGRVIEYSINGTNSIYLDPSQYGWVRTPGSERIDICGGRFDIGPETTGLSREDLWVGKWEAKITGPRQAQLISPIDKNCKIQLIRDFRLAENSSHLECKQTIINKGNTTVHVCHWSRTLADGGGICVIPLTNHSRFPKGYIYYGPGSVMNFNPKDDPSIRVRNGYLEILDTPPQPKFGIDSYAGWLGYITPKNVLFIKKFPVYPDRVYNEMAAFTISIWYYLRERCELEPIGPREILKPEEKSSFTEDWWLIDYSYPTEGKNVNLAEIENIVKGLKK